MDERRDVSDLEHAFAREVADLHEFFEDWFHGRDGRKIEEFSDRLDTGFVIVSPHGHELGKEQIVAVVEARTGSYEAQITTTDAVLHISDPVLVGTYREDHTFRGETTRRIATVAMAVDISAPTGYRWLSVHETWTEEQS